MERYVFSEEKRAALESLRQPLAVYQFLDRRVVTLLLSDGFCELFGYTDRSEAVWDMDNNMYKDTHPDDAARIADAAIRFATEGGRYEVIYRTRKKDGAGYVVVHAMGEHVSPEEGVRLAQVWYTDEGTYLEDAQTSCFELNRTLSNALHEQSILTELMRMATSLGLDTVCEGVETQSQMRFLQEIGCSKLQGYYYSKPISFETIRERYRDNTLIENENPRESEYYESIGRVNLFDLGVIAGADAALQNAFPTIPIAVMEVTEGSARYVRSNRSYQEFVRRFFGFDVAQGQMNLNASSDGQAAGFLSAVRQCCRDGNRAFFDERMPDGSVVHSFVRRIHANPVTGSTALAIAVLSVTEPEERASYADIARALAADYYNIFVIDLDTDEYIEYSSQVGAEELSTERHGGDFFGTSRKEAAERVYEEDRASFLALFTKEKVIQDLDAQGVFTLTYRLMDTGTPVYVQMKMTRMQGGKRIILGVSNVDAQMRQQEEEKRLRKERSSLGRIAALSPDFLVLYTVDPVSGHYTQYSPSHEFERFGLAKQGEDFFGDVRLDAPKAIAPEDMERHLRVLTKENVLRVIRQNGVFFHHYRLLMDGSSVPVILKATLVQEEDGEKLLLGVLNDDKEVYRHRLREAQKIRALNQTITSLLDNMPGLTFTKDAKTGVYLACNQAFAAYAHKATPDGVVGLTDAEIFDAETAAHFVEDDRRALSMEKPYIFYEDVPDAAGRQRQFQTTKLKYLDSTGRLCLQGMCQDVTDMVRIRRENASTKEAYERARSTGIIYTHIAQALARGITDLYYVNLETDELIEYHTDDTLGVLTEARRGTDFFEGCERDAKRFVHPEDQAAFVKAMNRAFLEKALEDAPVYELTYRRIKEGRAFYVRMRVSRVEEDPRFLVVAVSDIDELMRKRRAEERMMEERLVQAQSQANRDALTGVKNKHAFLEAEAQLDRLIAEHRQGPFAVVMLDVNGLKKVNDTLGHQAGDELLRAACKVICAAFAHSPVFRVGGDEFAVLSQGSDYQHIEELVERFHARNREALDSGGVVVACGMAKHEDDACLAAVFQRADQEMFRNKRELKGERMD